MKYTVSIRKEVIKIKAEINEIESIKTTEKVIGIKSWFFESISIKLISF